MRVPVCSLCNLSAFYVSNVPSVPLHKGMFCTSLNNGQTNSDLFLVRLKSTKMRSLDNMGIDLISKYKDILKAVCMVHIVHVFKLYGSYYSSRICVFYHTMFCIQIINYFISQLTLSSLISFFLA